MTWCCTRVSVRCLNMALRREMVLRRMPGSGSALVTIRHTARKALRQKWTWKCRCEPAEVSTTPLTPSSTCILPSPPPAQTWTEGDAARVPLTHSLNNLLSLRLSICLYPLCSDLDLETPPWPSVSRHAKDLVRRMLQVGACPLLFVSFDFVFSLMNIGALVGWH